MSKYDEDIQDAYDTLLEDGVMGHASLPGTSTYSPATGRNVTTASVVRNVPMLRAEIPANVRLAPDSLVSETDIMLLVAAKDDAGAAFKVDMGHTLQFAGKNYKPKTANELAPDGTVIMTEVIASGL